VTWIDLHVVLVILHHFLTPVSWKCFACNVMVTGVEPASKKKRLFLEEFGIELVYKGWGHWVIFSGWGQWFELPPEMEPDLRVTGHRVSDFGRVGSGQGSVCQTRCLTQFWVLTCVLIVALFLQS